MNIRLLKENEIEVRVGTINEKGATLLLYKDARVDMNILDESGYKWKRSHELINNNLFCTISIWDDEIKEWISRQDVGVESQSEKEKGQASDAFKRAGFNFGIGRELYTAPFIWISSDKYAGYTNKSGKPATYDKFGVSKIGYNDNKEINQLEIVNIKTGKVVFNLGKYIGNEEPKTTAQENIKIESDRQDMIKQITAVGVQLGYDMDFIDKKIAGIKTMAEAHDLLKTYKELSRIEKSKEPEVPFES